ncbi:hypothetical protein [Pedobacter faecalis]|uniref:hypothetical protein n=1 Tax=Pedobacter faecalis TaxID=3041495 RepID=UPI00254B3E0E|nr:hypothetical protein [Pedobacter sp. ELA7]
MMYELLLPLHSLFRWLVLFSLFCAVFTALFAYVKGSPFSKWHNSLRHWTATIAHIQLMLGILIYTKSPLVKAFFSAPADHGGRAGFSFFAVVHLGLMLLSIVLITIGSAKAKRQQESAEKFKTMLVWFSIALLIILAAIPWPFSPLASRPYFRNF